MSPWLTRLNGLSDILQMEKSQVRFLVRAHAWFVGQVPSWGRVLSHSAISLPLFLPSFPSP